VTRILRVKIGVMRSMNILMEAIVSNSDMIKNYKTCRGKAEKFGKIYILKNNQSDAVLFSIAEYKRLSVILEYLDSLDQESTERFAESLPSLESK
jgi:PHD/YefM family antitoxin component YafN of YafNO toxin-antitoxin module